jgi:hypothetical protein
MEFSNGNRIRFNLIAKVGLYKKPFPGLEIYSHPYTNRRSNKSNISVLLIFKGIFKYLNLGDIIFQIFKCLRYTYNCTQMRFALVLLFAFVVSISHQQLQRSRILPWLTSYSSFINKYQPLYYDDVVHHDVPFFRYSKPVRPTSSYIYSLQV